MISQLQDRRTLGNAKLSSILASTDASLTSLDFYPFVCKRCWNVGSRAG